MVNVTIGYRHPGVGSIGACQRPSHPSVSRASTLHAFLCSLGSHWLELMTGVVSLVISFCKLETAVTPRSAAVSSQRDEKIERKSRADCDADENLRPALAPLIQIIYLGVDYDIVWAVVTADLPRPVAQLERVG